MGERIEREREIASDACKVTGKEAFRSAAREGNWPVSGQARYVLLGW